MNTPLMTAQSLRNLLKDVGCLVDHPFMFHIIDKGIEGFLLQVSRFCDNYSPDGGVAAMREEKSGKYYISPFSTPAEVLQKALMACIQFMEHEVREAFVYKGQKIFNPHLSLEALENRAANTQRRS